MASLLGPRKHRSGKARETKIYGLPFHEEQFKKWIFDWEARVFMYRLVSPKQVSFLYSPEQYNLINELVESYHETQWDQVGQDRFVWTTFACTMIKEHQQHTQKSGLRHDKCQINRCLYILLWMAYYLRLHCSELVREILREIITCNGNLRFMFSFLPGMSIQSYTLQFSSGASLFEEMLCRVYFTLIDADISSMIAGNKDVFRHSQPFLLYLVQHLTPLHTHYNPVSMTLHEALNKAVLPDRKYSLLTLSIHYNDEVLVKQLLELGASAQMFYWDYLMGSSTSAERIMIASINSTMGSRQFLTNVNHDFGELMVYTDTLVNAISSYAPLIRRSVFRSEQRKSNNFWSSEDSTYELNREIADVWGLDYERPWPSLQHICKIRIRQQILEADRMLISEAILVLPLPNKMIQYLNLQCD